MTNFSNGDRINQIEALLLRVAQQQEARAKLLCLKIGVVDNSVAMLAERGEIFGSSADFMVKIKTGRIKRNKIND
jgi:hypothetical protein